MVSIAPPGVREAQERRKAILQNVMIVWLVFLLLWRWQAVASEFQGSFTHGDQKQATGQQQLRITSNRSIKHPASAFKLLPAISKKQNDKISAWPPLEDVYNGQDIIGDPQYLLDFAIIGFEKSGSSTFMKWLGAHPQVQCFQEEIYDLYQNKPGAMVWRLHTQLESGWDYKRGYKSPGDIFLANVIHLLDDYFPKTRLILALRHPIRYVSHAICLFYLI